MKGQHCSIQLARQFRVWPFLVAALIGLATAGCARRQQPATRDEQYQAIVDSGDAERQLYLAVEFRKPMARNIAALQRLTGKRVVRIDAKDRCYILLTEAELHDLLGLDTRHETVKGAGNTIDSDASFSSIADVGAMKPAYQAIIRDIAIDDDPKIELFEVRDALPPEGGGHL